MKIDQYGYIVKSIGPQGSEKNNWQSFDAYPLKMGLPILQSDNLALHYIISMHGLPYITVKENNLSIHVMTQFWKSAQDAAFANKFIAPLFIEKTKHYRNYNHTKFIFTVLFDRINAINPTYDKAYANHPYRELEKYCRTKFGFIDWTARTEIEAGR